MREIILYIPAGGHRATEGIARGSAIVGQPEGVGASEVRIYFEGSIYGAPSNMRTLADRATHAAGRMTENYPTTAMRTVPREALVAVGTFSLSERRISLTGPCSERAVAEWLGEVRLDPAELRPSREAGGPVPAAFARASGGLGLTRVKPELLQALIERGGLRLEGKVWVASDGRRTSEVGDALLWALESIAQGEG